MKIKASTIAMTLALAALPYTANAAGLGKITVLSVLGQPLRAEVEISANREELTSLAGRIAPNESFRQAGIEYVSALSDVRVSVATRTDGRPYLLLKSNRTINEAFIDLLLELNWDGGRLQREYTFLLDPPELVQPSTTQPAPRAQSAQPTQPTQSAQPAQSASASASPPAPATASSSSSNTPTKLSPSTASSPSKVSSASTPTASSEEKTTPDMKVVRDDNGTPRIVKNAKSAQQHPEVARQDYQVKQGDTLSKIAKNNLPEGVNLDQMLVALFRGNKDAFEGGNINRLKTGRILALPDQAAIDGVEPQEARRIILAQSADFNAYRKKLAAATTAAAPAQEESSQQSAKGKIEPQLQEPAAPPASTKDKLEISKSASNKDAHEKNLAARTAAIEEDIIAREKSLKEANSRIAELDKSLADMKKLLELKNKSLADTQNQAAGATATSVKPAEKPPISEVPAEQPTQKPTEKTAESPEKPIAPAAPQEQPATTPTPTSKPEPAHKAAPTQTHPPSSTPAPAPLPEASTSFIDDNPEVLYGGGGILALILGYLGFKTWRKRQDEQESHAYQDDLSIPSSSHSSQIDPSVNSVFGSTGGQVVDTREAEASIAPVSIDTDFSLASTGTNDVGEKVDPIAEADVYMAYGRTEQAEEILLDALKNDPARYALHLKLLDIYATRKALKPFENIARELHAQTDGNGSEWEQAAQLGRTIDLGNTLYAGNAATDTPPQEHHPYDPTATMVMTPQDIDKIAAVANTPMEQPLSEEVPESLDFELDLGGDSVQSDAPDSVASDAQASSAAAAPEQANDDIIDFDLDFPSQADTALAAASTPESEPKTETETETLPPIAPIFVPEANSTPEPAIAPSIELPSIQDAAMSFVSEEQPQPRISNTPQAQNNVSDLAFDLDDLSDLKGMSDHADSAPEMPSTGSSEALLPKAPRIDLSAISLDLDDTATVSLPPSHTLDMPHTSTSETSEASEQVAGDEPTLTLDTPPALEMPTLEEASAVSTEPTAADDTPGSPEVDTKLELANAYEEMGDAEGARELLLEVLNEGNERQKAEAQKKLAQLPDK